MTDGNRDALTKGYMGDHREFPQVIDSLVDKA